MNIKNLTSHPNPVQNYAEALQRIEALQARASPEMNPDCRLQFMTHGEKVERAIVFVHGYAYCPQQFRALGQRFFDLGDNVLVVPLPWHGLSDRLTEAQSRLTAEELAAYADEMVDIAQGLGTQTVLVGISGGGVTTAWAAQYRQDLGLAVIISPGFGFQQIPTALTAPAANLFLVVPNAYQWWDPNLKEAVPPAYAYPRYSTRALAQILRLGQAVRSTARQTPPAARAILVVTNANDNAVNNELITRVVDMWRKMGGQVTTFEFEKDLRLGHDLIDPTQPDQRIDLVYPRLIELINQ